MPHEERLRPTGRPTGRPLAANESFVVAALAGARGERVTALRERLRAAWRPRRQLACDRTEAIAQTALLLLGVPSSHRGSHRRRAARDSWMAVPSSAVVGCFLVSAQYRGARRLAALEREAAEHGDMLFLDAPETRWLITEPTRYSRRRSHCRGMPTFKQFAFFAHAATTLPSVPFIGKIDDDTLPNVHEVGALHAQARATCPLLPAACHLLPAAR